MKEEQKTSELKEVAGELVGWGDNKIIRTVKDLTIKPGTVVREYCAGEKQKYLSPVVYVFAVTAIETYLASAIGFFDFMLEQNLNSLRESFSDPTFASLGVDVSRLSDQMNNVFSFLFSETGQKLVILPIVLLLTWLLYKRVARSFKATSWFALFALGHITLLSLPLLAIWYFTQRLGLFTTLGLIVGSVYWIWSSMQAFHLKIGQALLLRLAMMLILFIVIPVIQIIIVIGLP